VEENLILIAPEGAEFHPAMAGWMNEGS